MNGLTALLCRLNFNGELRRRTWRKLAIQAQNNLSIDESLVMLRDQASSRKSPLAALYAHILMLKASGVTLDVALAGVATPEELLLISSGQDSGNLPETLLMAADLLEARQKIHEAVVGVIAYPLFLLTMCLGILLLIALYVMPELTLISDPELWTGMSAVLYQVSMFTASWPGLFTLALLLIFIATVGITLPIWTGPLRRRCDAVPPWSIYRLITGCSWLFTLAILMRSGMQLTKIVGDALAMPHTTPYLRERLEALTVHYGAGVNFGEALFQCGMDFPSAEIVDELRTYARLPGFEERLAEIARQWMTDGIAAIQQKAKTFNLACMLFIVGLICALGMAIMDMQKQLMQLGG